MYVRHTAYLCSCKRRLLHLRRLFFLFFLLFLMACGSSGSKIHETVRRKSHTASVNTSKGDLFLPTLAWGKTLFSSGGQASIQGSPRKSMRRWNTECISQYTQQQHSLHSCQDASDTDLHKGQTASWIFQAPCISKPMNRSAIMTNTVHRNVMPSNKRNKRMEVERHARLHLC